MQSFIELEVPTDVLNHFWIQVAVSEVKGPLRNRFGSEAVTHLQRLHVTAIPPTDTSVRSGVTVM
jgi:hypothetical protein